MQDGQLIKAEGRAVGRVKRTIYKTYLSAWGPFFLVPISMFSIALVERALQVRCLLASDCNPIARAGEVADMCCQRSSCDGQDVCLAGHCHDCPDWRLPAA